MTRSPNPRFRADVRLVIDISGADEAEAERRLEAICEFLNDRLARSTFRRLPGQPELGYADLPSDVVSL